MSTKNKVITTVTRYVLLSGKAKTDRTYLDIESALQFLFARANDKTEHRPWSLREYGVTGSRALFYTAWNFKTGKWEIEKDED